MRVYRGYGQQEGPCWTDTSGAVNCPPGYHIDSVTGRVVSDKETEVNWQPVVQAGTGLVLAIVNAATGQRYDYPAGQRPGYTPGYTYTPPKWYEKIPAWAWALGGGALVVAVMQVRGRG